MHFLSYPHSLSFSRVQNKLILTAKSLQSCPTLCNPRDGSPPGSPVPGILQARTLEQVAISFSNAWKWKVKVKSLSCVWPSSDPMDCSPPGSSVHGIFQARVLEWGATEWIQKRKSWKYLRRENMGKLWENLFKCLLIPDQLLVWGGGESRYTVEVLKVHSCSPWPCQHSFLSYSLPLLILECVLQEPNECNRVGQIVGTP